MKRPPSERLFVRAAWATLGLALLLLGWWLATRGAQGGEEDFGMARRFAPAPAFESLAALLGDPELVRHLTVSLRRIAVGLGGALALGVPLGLLIGVSEVAAWTSSAAFQLLRMISPLSLMPIAVMALGVGDKPIYYLLTFAAVWPVMLNTAEGVRALDRRWVELGRSLSATRLEMLLHVVLPGMLGHLLTGIRLAIGISWVVLVPCEMLGVSAGLGYFILDTRDRLAYSELMAMILIIGVLGFALDGLSRALCRRFAFG